VSFTRVIYEVMILKDEQNLVLGQVPFTQYCQKYYFELHPFIHKYVKEDLWLDFIQKYELMAREQILVLERNEAR
jgi:hypothetical protein